MSTRRPRLLTPLALASVLLAPALVPPVGGSAAAAQTTPAAERTFMRVTERLDVKSRPQDYYYTFLRLAEGDIVEVMSEPKNGFVSIRTHGPRFAAGFALLRVREDESFSISGPERVSATGRTVRSGVSDQRLQVLYPNVDEADLLDGSWLMMRRIDPGTSIPVMGNPISGEGVTLHLTPLPKDALGYVQATKLAPASPDEARDFMAWEADPAGWIARRRAEAESREQQRLAAEAEALAEAQRLARAEAETPVAPVIARPAVGETAETEADVEAAETGAETEITAPPVATQEQTLEETADPAVPTGSDANADTQTDPEAEVADEASEGDESAAETDAEPTGSEAVATLAPAERLEALEQAFGALRRENARRVEVLPLAALYRGFAADLTLEAPAESEFAAGRARQLELWARLQAQQDRIDALRRTVGETDVALDEAARSIQLELGFSAVGRLAGSRIFDGVRLPRLLRLEAIETGRTLAYVRDAGKLDLDSRIGDIVGLFGERTYDPGLQLDVIDATRVRAVRLDVEDGTRPGISEG